MLVPVRKYTNKRLLPAIYPELARTDAVRFAPGTYAAGLVVAQQTANMTAANDVQTLTVDATSGTFLLSVNGDITPALAFNIANTALAAAINALPSVGFKDAAGTIGNVAVTGGPGASGGLAPYVITYQNLAGNLPQADILIAAANVAGGGAAVTIAHTTRGRAAGGSWVAYNDGGSLGEDTAKGALEYDLVVDTQGYHFCGGGDWGSRKLSAPIFVKGYFRTADLTGLDANGIVDLGKIREGSASLLTDPGTILGIF